MKPKFPAAVTPGSNGVKKKLPPPIARDGLSSSSATSNCIAKKHNGNAARRYSLSSTRGVKINKRGSRSSPKKKHAPEHVLSKRFNGELYPRHLGLHLLVMQDATLHAPHAAPFPYLVNPRFLSTALRYPVCFLVPNAADRLAASLSASTDDILSTLTQALSLKLQIKLSRLTAAMAQSTDYLSRAEMTKEEISAAPIMSVAFDRDLAAYKKALAEKQGELDVLWKEREQCLVDIQALKQEAEEFEHAGADDGSILNTEGDWEQMCEDIRGIGRKWIEKIEKNEKKFAEDEKKRNLLAKEVML